MKPGKLKYPRWRWLVFTIFFFSSIAIAGVLSVTGTVAAAPAAVSASQSTTYAGAESCKQCHEDIYTQWVSTRHAQAFSSPIFQRDWVLENSVVTCLQCHTTGYAPENGSFAQAGVTCEACHGAFQSGHPKTLMPITPDYSLCSTCHKTTTDEWRASQHGQAGPPIQCQACHNPHSQSPIAATVTELCSNCHKERGTSFTHSTHANAGLECSNCHMYTSPRTQDPIEGLIPTGHTFSVGSEACVGCHQDTVHTRDTILALTGEATQAEAANIETLQLKVQDQGKVISALETRSNLRLYTGLAQGAIIGLVTGVVAAWVVSRRIQEVEVDE